MPRDLVVGRDIPAEVGMALSDIATPALVVDLEAFEANLDTMAADIRAAGVRLRAHAKTHKSADVARLQMTRGGAVGICCQKVSEAEALVDAGIDDVLVSNQVVAPRMVDRLAALAARARIGVCVDDRENISALSAAATRHGTALHVLLEIDCGQGRCGIPPGPQAIELTRQIQRSDGLHFEGIQAYQGAAQHIRAHADRAAAIADAASKARATVDALAQAGIACETVAGAGTGSYEFEVATGLYNELQCGSYVFMDRDYREVLQADGQGLTRFRNALFVLTTVISHAKADLAVCDAGHKSHAIDSGLPAIHGAADLTVLGCSDEHTEIRDPAGRLAVGDRLMLVPGHCDPTCNLHDWYVVVRGERVEALWPVTARGRYW